MIKQFNKLSNWHLLCFYCKWIAKHRRVDRNGGFSTFHTLVWMRGNECTLSGSCFVNTFQSLYINAYKIVYCSVLYAYTRTDIKTFCFITSSFLNSNITEIFITLRIARFRYVPLYFALYFPWLHLNWGNSHSYNWLTSELEWHLSFCFNCYICYQWAAVKQWLIK